MWSAERRLTEANIRLQWLNDTGYQEGATCAGAGLLAEVMELVALAPQEMTTLEYIGWVEALDILEGKLIDYTACINVDIEPPEALRSGYAGDDRWEGVPENLLDRPSPWPWILGGAAAIGAVIFIGRRWG